MSIKVDLFPCPECGKRVRLIRAVKTNAGWQIESATGVGSLQTCCLWDQVFPNEAEAKWYAEAVHEVVLFEAP